MSGCSPDRPGGALIAGDFEVDYKSQSGSNGDEWMEGNGPGSKQISEGVTAASFEEAVSQGALWIMRELLK